MSAPRATSRTARVAVLAAAGLIGAVGLLEIDGDEFYRPYGRWLAAVVLSSTALLALRRAPLAVLAGLLALQVLIPWRIDAEAVPLFQFAATVLACVAVGLFVRRRDGLLAMLGVGLFYLTSAAVAGGGADQWFPAGASIFFLVGGWGVASAVRSRTERTHELETEATRLATDREALARAAVADERRRIARELHDAVAHSVSLMVLQTGAVRQTLRGDVDAERELLGGVERTGRDAVEELHRMLGMLRVDDQPVELAPPPSLDLVEELVESVRHTGLQVDLVVEGDRRPLPAGLELCAYRIVQEALTNVLKHADAGRARVTISFDRRQLRLEVIDDGTGQAAVVAGGGQGLVGMRERVLLYGGELDARAETSGGFGVRARLPLGSGAE